MYAPRQRGVQPASTNGQATHSSHWVPRMGPGAIWIARIARLIFGHLHHLRPPIVGAVPSHVRRMEPSWFDSADRRGGHSGGATPVPIPNTADKPASVPASTGVREPLGKLPCESEGPSTGPGAQSEVHAGSVPVEPETAPLQRPATGGSPPFIHTSSLVSDSPLVVVLSTISLRATAMFKRISPILVHAPRWQSPV